MPALLVDGPTDAALTVCLAHGAGAPMDSPFMSFFATGLAAAGYRVVRFEFPYMAASRRDGRRRPPDRPDGLARCWQSVIAGFDAGRLIIGGKSLGGRIASRIADAAGVRGFVGLGYPFHPPGRLERPRLDGLATLRTPALIVQGTRDPFGDRREVSGYALSPAVSVHWLADGDHGFQPRAGSGRSLQQNLDEALAVVLRFLGNTHLMPVAGR
jgi:hypothetical protein